MSTASASSLLSVSPARDAVPLLFKRGLKRPLGDIYGLPCVCAVFLGQRAHAPEQRGQPALLAQPLSVPLFQSCAVSHLSKGVQSRAACFIDLFL